MKPVSSDPDLVNLSTATYRLLLIFYPLHFRQEYGPHMAQVFRDCCLKTYRRSGTKGLLALWAQTLLDWFKTVIEEQFNRGTEMTRTKFIRLSGWGLILAAVSLLLTFLPEADKILDRLYRTFGAPDSSTQQDLYQGLAVGVSSLPFPIAILFITFGLVGLRARYGEQTGFMAKIALGIGIFSGAASLVSSVWLQRPITNLSLAFMFGGLFVFGLIALRLKPMRRGNGLPVLAGFWWMFLVIQAYIAPQTLLYLGPLVPIWYTFAIFSSMSVSLALLGFVLQADLNQNEVAV